MSKLSLKPVDMALLWGYQMLGEESSGLFGYPIRVSRAESDSLPIFRTSDIGELVYALPGSKNKTIGEFVLPAIARTDSFATSLAISFVKACDRMRHEVKQPGDVNLYFLRFDKYIKDNILVSRTHSMGKKFFLLKSITAIRDSLSYRYEGEPVSVGLVATWSWEKLKARLEENNCNIFMFSEGFDLKDRLKVAKSSYLLTDGITSFYASTPKAYIDRMVVIPEEFRPTRQLDWQLVPEDYIRISSLINSGDVLMTANSKGEIWYSTGKTIVKWSANRWHRVSSPPLTELLADHVPQSTASRMAEVVVDLSSRRIGALIVMGEGAIDLSKTSPTGISKQFEEGWSPMIENMSSEFLSRLAAIDGATIISKEGSLIDAGVILRVPAGHTLATEGARSAAASYAGLFGLSIKISHDGPVSIYNKHGVLFQAA